MLNSLSLLVMYYMYAVCLAKGLSVICFTLHMHKLDSWISNIPNNGLNKKNS